MRIKRVSIMLNRAGTDNFTVCVDLCGSYTPQIIVCEPFKTESGYYGCMVKEHYGQLFAFINTADKQWVDVIDVLRGFSKYHNTAAGDFSGFTVRPQSAMYKYLEAWAERVTNYYLPLEKEAKRAIRALSAAARTQEAQL